MGMGIGINTFTPDAGNVKGHQEAIACGVWFTSTGTAIPKMIKFLDEEGCEHILSHIHVRSSEQKFYCGIPTIEYVCETDLGSQRLEFHLLYYIDRQQWKLLWKHAYDVGDKHTL